MNLQPVKAPNKHLNTAVSPSASDWTPAASTLETLWNFGWCKKINQLDTTQILQTDPRSQRAPHYVSLFVLEKITKETASFTLSTFSISNNTIFFSF